MVTGAASGGTVEAVKFLFTPDFSKINGEVAAAALGQACFSIGIGSAIMITYGSYLPQNVSIPKAALTVGAVDTCVALIAGMAIFPIVFANNLDFSAGAGIFFQTIPTAMSTAPAGNLIGAAFFFLAIFAAVTSSISLLEPIAAWFAEAFNKSKQFAAMAMGGVMLFIGSICVFSSEFFDFIDGGLTGPIMLPLSALLVVLFTGFRLKKSIINEEFAGEGEGLGRILLFFVRYFAPLFIGIVLIIGIYNRYFVGGA
jgi:NSS family neurotransmitter:Na+ symporter